MEQKTKKFDIIEKYFIYFMMYSCIGWLYEVFLEVVVYKWGFSNRGFLFGPYCPVYGFGALAFIISLKKLKESKIKIGKINITPILVFLGIILIATTMELITSYIMEAFTGGWLWDYAGYPLNFQGRIALNPSIRFGIGGMVFMYILQPIFNKTTEKLSKRKLDIIFVSLALIISVDFIIKIV